MISEETIVNQDYTSVTLAGSRSFKEGIQGSGDRVL